MTFESSVTPFTDRTRCEAGSDAGDVRLGQAKLIRPALTVALEGIEPTQGQELLHCLVRQVIGSHAVLARFLGNTVEQLRLQGEFF